MDLTTHVSLVHLACAARGLTVCLGLCVDALLANNLQLLCGDAVDQPIFFIDRFCSNWLERDCRHGEGKGRTAGVGATRAALSVMVGHVRGLPAGSFLCWLD